MDAASPLAALLSAVVGTGFGASPVRAASAAAGLVPNSSNDSSLRFGGVAATTGGEFGAPGRAPG